MDSPDGVAPLGIIQRAWKPIYEGQTEKKLCGWK